MTPFVATDEPVAAAPPNHHHQLQRQRNQEHRDDVADEQHKRAAKRSRTMTSTEEIDNTITRPGSVKINVQGAFIVDPDVATPAQNGSDNGRVSPSHHETSDIRLPNHTAIVSHIAVDVGRRLCIIQHLLPSFEFILCPLSSCCLLSMLVLAPSNFFFSFRFVW